ncbi:560_t:CDS:2 [Diversispora eburnea]|uniref:560_t:CDS:1 n=1 Tax=Diversispora eburnea TaxID=1213867 RepID=A0A9N9F527_9GLOM|nr:560_t:CDS:2 [Diversispora eburnea]
MKCTSCSLDKLSREFPSDIISQKCTHVSTYCLKTIIALRETLRKQTGVEVSKQKLIYKGTELNNYNTGRVQCSLNEYGIVAESHIQLIVLLYSISKELSIQNLTFELYWGYPMNGCDYLDGTCMLYTGNKFWRKYDYQSTTYFDIPNMSHSGDLMDHVNRRGHHRILANLSNLPTDVTKLYFILSSWNSPNIGHFPNPSFRMYDSSTPNINLCTYTIQQAASSQAVIMCCVGKNNLDGSWAVYEVGQLSAGNAKNYVPIEYTIGTLDSFFITS